MNSTCFFINLFLLNFWFFNNLFVLGQHTGYSKGCYKEKSGTARLLPDSFTSFKGSLTPDICIRECRTKGYDYAGVEMGTECFCSNFWPTYTYTADEEDCSIPCPGNKTEKCGGSHRLNIYETHDAVSSLIETNNYLGCMDMGSKRLLTEKSKFFLNKLTPEICIGYCYRNGHRFAGLLSGECMCGDTDINILKKNFVDNGECNEKCGNNRHLCGGYMRSRTYSTGITDYSEDENLLGCYEDGPSRLLTGFYMKYADNNSPRLCYNTCVGSGFKYAGLQIGVECFCGNIKPRVKLRRSEQDCAIPCPGDKLKNCGGVWRMVIYSSEETGVGEPEGYRGCYEDGPLRILTASLVTNKKNNTISSCIQFCRNAGFKYAGLQVGNACLCGNDKINKDLLRPEYDCGIPCSGEPSKECGGHWRMKIYSTNRSIDNASGVYKGCYRERSVEARLLFEDYYNMRVVLTPDLCVRECRSKDFSYAGLQVGSECFCSNTWPSYIFSTEEEECHFPCHGDKTLNCGAQLRLNIYETDEIEKNPVENKYIGCLNSNNKKLFNKKYKLFDNITPDFCIGYCFRSGYRFASLESRECRCGSPDIDVMKKDLVDDSECNTKCGNDHFFCGGQTRSSIYSTGITGDSEDDGLLGCYEDSASVGLISAFHMKYPENNSPNLCYNICNGIGFKYAGLKNGDICACGNVKPDSSLKRPKEDCAKPCPREPKQVCGGDGDSRVLIYITKGEGELDNYIGCYEDGNDRILPDLRKEMKTDNRGELCINHCRTANYTYAGTQFGFECFCGNNKPPDRALRAESECGVPCPGDSTKGCGGNWRMSIYNTQ